MYRGNNKGWRLWPQSTPLRFRRAQRAIVAGAVSTQLWVHAYPIKDARSLLRRNTQNHFDLCCCTFDSALFIRTDLKFLVELELPDRRRPLPVADRATHEQPNACLSQRCRQVALVLWSLARGSYLIFRLRPMSGGTAAGCGGRGRLP